MKRPENTTKQYSSLKTGIEYVQNKLDTFEWVIDPDYWGNYWICTNPDGICDEESVYASSHEDVVALFVIVTARTIGYDWAFE